jgi:hypothetical protein
MANLSDDHQRKILSTFQYADRLLEESLRILDSANRSPLSVYQSNLSESEMRHVFGCVEQIRTQMVALLEHFQVNRASSEVFTSWAVMTNLRTIAMAFNEILTKNMRGYGEVGSDTERELNRAVNQLIRSVDQLRNSLSEPKSVGRTSGP